jgi:hypothetical protein
VPILKLGRRPALDKGGKSRINTYCHDSPKGKRPKPSAEVLYLACAILDFSFEYKGYRISAATLNGGPKTAAKESEQLPLGFDGQFDLTDDKGTVSVRVKQPPGRIEVSLSLKTALLESLMSVTGRTQKAKCMPSHSFE